MSGNTSAFFKINTVCVIFDNGQTIGNCLSVGLEAQRIVELNNYPELLTRLFHWQIFQAFETNTTSCFGNIM